MYIKLCKINIRKMIKQTHLHNTKKICILGDTGVGKTTFIKLLITGTYTENNEKVLRENIILDTKKFGIKYYIYPVEIIDGSGVYEKEEIISIVKECNVVVLMYDFHNQNSLNKIKFDILPLLNNQENIYSVIVVGNKIDLLDINTQKFMIEQDKTEIEKFQEDINVNLKYFHISCKNYSGISPLFSEILDSLINPSHILYKQVNDELTFNERFERALQRIFRIFDKDRKGVLSKTEFNKIHEAIFDVKMEADHYSAIRECIKISNSAMGNIPSKGEVEDEFTLEGFINLNKISVKVGESQTTWSILRKFGYTDTLELDNWYFKSKKFQKVDILENLIELSDTAISLLTGIFNQFKNVERTKANSNIPVITEKEWSDIFSTCAFALSEDFSFDKIFNTNKNYSDKLVTLDDWIFLWRSFARINYEEAFKIFLYIGFDIDFDVFAKVINKSEVNLFSKLEHKTIHICFVAQIQESINDFLKYFANYYCLVEGDSSKQRDMIMKAGPYSVIVSNYLMIDLEFSITNLSTSTLDSFKKYDLLVFSDDIYASKVISFASFKLPYFVFRSHGSNFKESEDNVKSIEGANLQELVDDKKLNQNIILEKILSFANEPINYLKFADRKEVIRVRRRKNILFSLKFLFIGFAGVVTYYFAAKRFNLFKTNN